MTPTTIPPTYPAPRGTSTLFPTLRRRHTYRMYVKFTYILYVCLYGLTLVTRRRRNTSIKSPGSRIAPTNANKNELAAIEKAPTVA